MQVRAATGKLLPQLKKCFHFQETSDLSCM